MMDFYQALIAEIMAEYGWSADPRHIEAFMRAGHATLDGLDRTSFRHEIQIALACIDEGGTELAERVAVSYGF